MEDLDEKIGELVKSAMKGNLAQNRENWPFQNPDDYRQKTGKKFRMTKAQKESGISREEAFEQFMESLITKS